MNDTSKYIEIIPSVIQGKKTGRWHIVNKRDNRICGMVKWYGGFRSYAFFPEDGFLFDSKCMRQIANFIDEKMAFRTKAAKKKHQNHCRASLGFVCSCIGLGLITADVL